MSSPRPDGTLLETIAAGIMLVVLAALGWIVLVAYWPLTFTWASTQVEVVVILVLLSAALVVVIAVALVHTRPGSGQAP